MIPKEIRKTLKIREGDPVEIFTDNQGQVILKKYSPIGEIGNFAKAYAEAMSQIAGHRVLVTDREKVIAVAGSGTKDFWENVSVRSWKKSWKTGQQSTVRTGRKQ